MNDAFDEMIVTNVESVPGRTVIEHYGIVQGSTIRAKHIGRDMMARVQKYCWW